MTSNPFLTERLQGFGTTIFTQMSALAVETQSPRYQASRGCVRR